MKYSIFICAMIFLAVLSSISSKRRRRRNPAKTKEEKLKHIEDQIREFSTIDFYQETQVISRIEGFIAKLEVSAPACAKPLKQTLHNVKNLYKKLDTRGQDKSSVAWQHKAKEAKQSYEPFFQEAVKCWKAVKGIARRRRHH